MERTPENPWGIDEALGEIFYGPGFDSLKNTVARTWPGCTVDIKFLPIAGDSIMKFRSFDGSSFYAHFDAEIIVNGKTEARIKTFLSTDKI